jgi:hypothetical protein
VSKKENTSFSARNHQVNESRLRDVQAAFKEKFKMERYVSRHLRLFFSAGLVIALSLVFFGVTRAQQFPGIPKLPGGISVPNLPGASSGFAGVGALTAAKELTGQKDKTTYPTANIAVSGNHIVIAWPNGVVSVETIADDGTLSRTVLGPPTENNIAAGKK